MSLTLCGHRAADPPFDLHHRQEEAQASEAVAPLPASSAGERLARVMWTLCTAVLCRFHDTGATVSWRTPFEAEKNEIVLQGAGRRSSVRDCGASC